MARIYGGILGLLAFLTTLVRGWIHGRRPQSHPMDCLAQPAAVRRRGRGHRPDRRTDRRRLGHRPSDAELAAQEENEKTG